MNTADGKAVTETCKREVHKAHLGECDPKCHFQADGSQAYS